MLSIKAGGTWTSSGPNGGTWLHHLGFVGDVKYLRRRPGGFATLSWRMSLPSGFTHPALRQGALVELYEAGRRIGYGLMAEPDRVGWEFVADGMPIRLGNCLALDSSGAPTTNIKTAVTQAAARGWPILADDGLPNTSYSPLSESVSNLNYLPDLLDAYCATNNTSWTVDAAGYVKLAADDTAPSWILTPGTPAMATADDDYASLVVVRYVSAMTGSDPTDWDVASASDPAAADRWGVQETLEDETSLGLLSATQASNNAKAILNANRARPAFTQSVEVQTYQLTTMGGVPAHRTLVREQQMVRHMGVLDSDGAVQFGATLDWVIGSVEVTEGEPTITLTPRDLAARTLPKIIQGITDTETAFA